jgi:sulfatase modifying factor 1
MIRNLEAWSARWLAQSRRRASTWVASLVTGLVSLAPADAGAAPSCPKGMVSIAGKYCIDAYEAATVEIDAPRKGRKQPRILRKHSPYEPVTGLQIMAVSEKGRVPQGHISRDEAEQACLNAGKRLCLDEEWLGACRGPKETQFPYGDERKEGHCNDSGFSGFNKLFGPGNNVPPEASVYTSDNMNDPRLNQLPGTLAKAGAFSKCRTKSKVYDLVGNLHEWTADPSGTFRGGYYLDTRINGEGCGYRTTAHDRTYHDYSTGFRCCFGGKEQKRLDAERSARERADAAAKKRAASESKRERQEQAARAKGTRSRTDASTDRASARQKNAPRSSQKPSLGSRSKTRETSKRSKSVERSPRETESSARREVPSSDE